MNNINNKDQSGQGNNDQDKKNNSNTNLGSKQVRSFEQKFIEVCGMVFTLPYNIGISILTFALWYGCFAFSYSSTGNFNLFVTIAGYMLLGSLAGVIYGQILSCKSQDVQKQVQSMVIAKLALISLVLVIFMLMGVKIFAFQQIGVYLLSPISMFSFFLLLKTIWMGAN